MFFILMLLQLIFVSHNKNLTQKEKSRGKNLTRYYGCVISWLAISWFIKPK